MRTILIITPYDRESLNTFLGQFKESIKELPIEVQSPGFWADYIYRNMDKQDAYSFFTCFLAGVDAYRNMAKREEVFITSAPLRFMIGNSPKDIVYDEIWLYRENVSSTHEAILEYYRTRTKGEIDVFLDTYNSEDATRKFNTFKGLVSAVSKELSKEISGYGDL
jgi:hypothetical protein